MRSDIKNTRARKKLLDQLFIRFLVKFFLNIPAAEPAEDLGTVNM